MLRVESFAKRLKIFNCSRAYHKHHLIFKQPLKKSKTDVNRFRAPFLPSLVTSLFRLEQGAATRLILDRSVYYIVHSLLRRLRKPLRYSQISSKFKQANGYTVMTWYLGSLHVKWRLRAQICHHLKFNCVTRACIFLTVFPLKTHTKKINWFISDYCIGCDAWKKIILLARLSFLRMYLLNFKASTTLISIEVTRTNFVWLSGI